MNKIEFRIVKDSNGNDVTLENLSVDATNSLIEILTALRNITIYENNPELTIGIKSGSACASINGPTLEIVRENFMKVVRNDSERENVYVNNMQVIQNQMKKPNLEIEVNYFENGIQTPVIELFAANFRLKRERKIVENNFNIEFFNAKLMINGGKKPNFHIEDKQIPYIISCTEEEAIKVNSFLYKDIKISAWGKMNSKGKMEYTFCDIYNVNERDFYNEFKTFFAEINISNGTEPMKKIHYKLKNYYSNQEFKESRKFIKLFCNEYADINQLMTILIISKAFKFREELNDLLTKIEKIIVLKTKRPVL